MVNIVYAAIVFAVGLTIVKYSSIRNNVKVLIAVLIILGFMLGLKMGFVEI